MEKPDFMGWAFAETDDEEQWTGPFDTRQDAIDEALIATDWETFCVAKCFHPTNGEREYFDDDIDFVIRGKIETLNAEQEAAT